jgi:signal transduction histidine kinase
MPGDELAILLIEDDLAEARFLQEILKGFRVKQFNLVHVKRLAEALQKLEQDGFDVILLDLTLPDSQGLASLKSIIYSAPDLPVVVLTNTNDDELAIEAVRQGAQDYLVKRKVNGEGLVRSLRYAIERKRVAQTLREENQALVCQVRERTAELDKVRELNQIKSEFVSMLSHDFRNPINTVLASAGLLQERESKLTEQQKLALFQMIRSAGNNMVRLLDEVLLVGRADADSLKFYPAPLDLVSFCRQLVEELQIGTGKNHQLVFTSKGNIAQTIWDEDLLRHILGNLLANAVKYSPEGSIVELELTAEEKTATFVIRDRGIGIPSEELQNLFQPFHRASNVGKIPGTGLGLAIVKRCVEVHGGQISVESEVGAGTIFTVALPLVREAVGYF